MIEPPFSSPETREAFANVENFVRSIVGDERLAEMTQELRSTSPGRKALFVRERCAEFERGLSRAGYSAQIIRGARFVFAMLITAERPEPCRFH